MNSNKKSKEIDIKNRTFYYFDHIINNVAYKTPYGSKPLGINFDKLDVYIRNNGSTKSLGLFHCDENYEKIFDRIRYLSH